MYRISLAFQHIFRRSCRLLTVRAPSPHHWNPSNLKTFPWLTFLRSIPSSFSNSSSGDCKQKQAEQREIKERLLLKITEKWLRKKKKDNDWNYRGVWNQMIFKVPFNPNNPKVLWFYEMLYKCSFIFHTTFLFFFFPNEIASWALWILLEHVQNSSEIYLHLLFPASGSWHLKRQSDLSWKRGM